MATTNSISSLLTQIPDANLRAELSRAVEEALRDRQFGLVFEEHLPEVQALVGVPIRKATRVAIASEPLNCTYRVESLEMRKGVEWAQLRREGGLEGEIQRREIAVSNLIPVARYGEAIYPSLRALPDSRVERAPGAPFHSIINADNYHALQLLLYGYQRAFDVIYIDPPYNTGARDWKYNNDYIDKNDRFRHSKWLSMMKKRLILAKQLLKPDGVLVLAIDENEVHHLLVLTNQLFPELEASTITIVQNPRGNKTNNFARTHEYAVYLIPRGQTALVPIPRESITSNPMRRWGALSTRIERKQSFYPIYIKDGKITRVGSWVQDMNWHPAGKNVILETGEVEVWPVDVNGIERRWGFGLDTIEGELDRIGIVQQDDVFDFVVYSETTVPKTVWIDPKFEAGRNGASLVKHITGVSFPYPKSIYTTEQCLKILVRNKPDALILDFFAGSGTTLHATCLLNAEDGGNRRCVLVTNNEVSESEAKTLAKNGFKPGDEEWEREGICRAVTIPRCRYSINGARDDGTPLTGTYLSGRALADGFEANLQAFSLDFLDPLSVMRGRRFEDIAPILWLLAGARGDLISPAEIADSKAWIAPKGSEFVVCRDDTRFGETLAWLESLDAPERARLRHIFLVTNAREAWMEWREILAALLPSVEVHQLYRDYLENYRLGENRAITDESLVSTLDEDTE